MISFHTAKKLNDLIGWKEPTVLNFYLRVKSLTEYSKPLTETEAIRSGRWSINRKSYPCPTLSQLYDAFDWGTDGSVEISFSKDSNGWHCFYTDQDRNIIKTAIYKEESLAQVLLESKSVFHRNAINSLQSKFSN